MMNVQCPKCFLDKPIGAKVCPNCVQPVSNKEVVTGEFWSIFWTCVIFYVIFKLIT
jgi:hypothetical protein